jgi:glycosyltransferase involved in cell wall biosynthesis
MFELGRYLVSRGHRVTVLTTDAWDGARRIPDKERELEGVRVLSFRNISNRLAWNRKVFLPIGLMRYLSQTAREFDIVHISAVRSLLHSQLHRVLRKAGVPYVVDAHGALPKPVGWKGLASRVYDPLFLYPFLRHAGALLAQTRHEAELYRTYAPDGHVEQLPLPIRVAEFDRPVASGVLRSRLGISHDTFLALFLGRIEHRKGVEFLLDAFARFRSQASGISACLAIVGRDSGSLAKVLRRIDALGQGDAVKFVGPLYGDERLEAYRDADVFALTPPYWEETSLAALEACALGTPCVITRQAEIPGLDEAGAGVTIAYGDQARLAGVLRKLAMNPDLRREMGRRAAELVRRHFAVEQVGCRLERIYSAVLEERT